MDSYNDIDTSYYDKPLSVSKDKLIRAEDDYKNEREVNKILVGKKHNIASLELKKQLIELKYEPKISYFEKRLENILESNNDEPINKIKLLKEERDNKIDAIMAQYEIKMAKITNKQERDENTDKSHISYCNSSIETQQQKKQQELKVIDTEIANLFVGKESKRELHLLYTINTLKQSIIDIEEKKEKYLIDNDPRNISKYLKEKREQGKNIIISNSINNSIEKEEDDEDNYSDGLDGPFDLAKHDREVAILRLKSIEEDRLLQEKYNKEEEKIRLKELAKEQKIKDEIKMRKELNRNK